MFQGQCNDSGIETSGKNILRKLNCVSVRRTYRAVRNQLLVHRSEQTTNLLINEGATAEMESLRFSTINGNQSIDGIFSTF